MRTVYLLLLLGSSVLVSRAQLTGTPPKMKSKFESHYYLPAKSVVDLTLTCYATGDNVMYEWQRNKFPAQNTAQRKIDKGTMMFLNTNSDEVYGTYQCFAKNEAGRALSREFEVIEAFVGNFPQGDLFQITANADEYVNFKCQSRPVCEPPDDCSYVWKIGDGTEINVDPSERIAVDLAGTLHFLYADVGDSNIPSDTKKNKYSCGLYNEETKTLKMGSPTELTVNAVPASAGSEIRMRFPTSEGKTITGWIGGKATLQCVFSSKPLPTITWKKKNGDRISKDDNNDRYEITDFSRKLTIFNLTDDDTQTYECEASNAASSRTVAAEVELRVIGPPQPVGEIVSQVVTPAGFNAEFSCDTRSPKSSDPPATPVWYDNGDIINAFGIDVKFNTRNEGKVLIVQNVQKTYTGNLQCSVRNPDGTFFQDYSLIAIDPIVMLRTPVNSLEILSGESKSISVDARADKQFTLRFDWTFVDKEGVSYKAENFPPELQLSGDRKNLTLDGSNLEGNDISKLIGTYFISVNHDYESRNYTVTVTTDSVVTTAPVVTTAGGFNPMIIAIILGVIFLFVVIFLIICVLYRNRGGTYPLDKKELAAGHDPEKELADSGFQDLSRADGIDDEKQVTDRLSLDDSLKNYDSGEDDLDDEYAGDYDVSKFNEDGSFIGQYADTKRPPPTQSVV